VITSIDTKQNIWKSSAFVTLFSSALLVAFASKVYDLALPLLVYELTQSAKWMGWMRAVEFLPNLLLALFIGVWVDRVDKKRWSQQMLIGQALMVILSFSAVQWMSQPLWVLFPAAFLMMAFNYGYHNARMAMLKRALPQNMQNTATARMSSLYSFMETVGPVLSGVLLLMAAIHYALLVVAAMLVLAYWQLDRLDEQPPLNQNSQSFFASLSDAWSVFVGSRTMVLITLAVMVINTTGSVFWIQAIYFAKAELTLNSVQVSYLVAASGVGGMFGSFTADIVRQKMGLGRLLILSIALEAIGFLFPIVWPTLWGLGLGFLWVSAVGLYSTICIWSFRQEAFDEKWLGRIAGITGSLFKLLMPLGLAASGYWVEGLGVTSLFLLCFVVQASVAFMLLATRVRNVA
jgi:MFS family permease